MSYRNYQNKQHNDQNSDLLDDLYSRLADRETSSDLDLTQSIKSMSKRWLQEAYIDGMMLADKLNRVTSNAKQNLDGYNQKKSEFEYDKSENSSLKGNDMAEMVQLEVQNQLQKLGFSESKQQSTSKPQNSFANFAFGMILLLSGFFIIGGAAGYYGLDSKVASVADRAYSSLTASQKSQNKSVDQNMLAQNQATTLATQSVTGQPASKAAVAPQLASSQNLINATPTPESDAPAFVAPNNAVAANAQNLSTDMAPAPQVNPTQSAAKTLPASCNGQEPVLNKPLNIQNPSDRAMLYCILDLQAQNQATNSVAPTQNSYTQPQTMPNQSLGGSSQMPNLNQIPQR